MTSIDLNADLGEGAPDDDELLTIVSSCSIACGGHAGDTETMAATVTNAAVNGVVAGAHPGYPDRDGFGRRSGFLRGEALYESLCEQITALADIAARVGVRLMHVKPHGALYTDAVGDAELAQIVARATADTTGTPALIGMAGSELDTAARRHAITFVGEAFVDRAYETDGTLVPRSLPGAVHGDPAMVASQATRLAQRGVATARDGSEISVAADTLCIHGDSPGAAQSARAVRDVLEANGVEIRAYTQR